MDRITYLSSPNNKVLFSSCPQVSHILNVAYGVENVFPLLFIYKSVQILDQPDTELTAHLKDCCRFITQAQEEVSPPPLHSLLLLLHHHIYTSKHITSTLHLSTLNCYTSTSPLSIATTLHLHLQTHTSTPPPLQIYRHLDTHPSTLLFLHLYIYPFTPLYCSKYTATLLHCYTVTPPPLLLYPYTSIPILLKRHLYNYASITKPL